MANITFQERFTSEGMVDEELGNYAPSLTPCAIFCTQTGTPPKQQTTNDPNQPIIK